LNPLYSCYSTVYKAVPLEFLKATLGECIYIFIIVLNPDPPVFASYEQVGYYVKLLFEGLLRPEYADPYVNAVVTLAVTVIDLYVEELAVAVTSPSSLST
jgi:hypothetical protein